MNGSTTQPNLLELAKQGNAQAIATLMNRQLQSKGITIKTNLAQSCLMVIAESQAVPEQAFLVDFIRKAITNLKVEVINRVIVQGRVTGETAPAWRESVELSLDATPAQKQSTESNKISIGSTSSFKPQVNTPRTNRFTNILSAIKGIKELSNTALLLGILLVLTANLFASNQSQPTLWEYKVESIEDGGFEQAMHRMGAKGWELASARRAISGEGASSQGLYEVIFKRPASKGQIRENEKRLEAEAKESGLQSAQLLAKINIGSINRAQQASFLEKNALATTVEELGLELNSDTDSYSYTLTADPSKSLVTASAKTDELKSYIGAVFLVQDSDVTTTVAITCETNTPSKSPLESPQLNGSKPVCPAGSSEVN